MMFLLLALAAACVPGDCEPPTYAIVTYESGTRRDTWNATVANPANPTLAECEILCSPVYHNLQDCKVLAFEPADTADPNYDPEDDVVMFRCRDRQAIACL